MATTPNPDDSNEWITVGCATNDRHDKKKLSKLVKKANRGEINTYQCYHACVTAGIVAKPEIYITPGKSRESSQHGLNLSEIRELLLALFSESVPPRYFTIKNKASIRTVVLVHVMDATPDCLKGLTSSRPVLVRISRQDREWNLLPERLLTMDDEEAQLLVDKMHKNDGQVSTDVNGGGAGEGKQGGMTGGESGKTNDPLHTSRNSTGSDTLVRGLLNKLEPYVLTEGALRLWGYPLPLPSPFTTTTTSSSSFPSITTGMELCGEDHESSSKSTVVAAVVSSPSSSSSSSSPPSSSSSVARPAKRPRIDGPTITNDDHSDVPNSNNNNNSNCSYDRNDRNNNDHNHRDDDGDVGDSPLIVGVLTGNSQHLLPSKRFAQRLLGLGLGLGSGLGPDEDTRMITSSHNSASSSLVSAAAAVSSSAAAPPPLPSFSLSRVQVQDGTTALLDGFVETLSEHSTAYQHLWPTTGGVARGDTGVAGRGDRGVMGRGDTGGTGQSGSLGDNTGGQNGIMGGQGGSLGDHTGVPPLQSSCPVPEQSSVPHRPSPHPLVAVDCEMCDTSEGLVLTRLTLVDHASQVVTHRPHTYTYTHTYTHTDTCKHASTHTHTLTHTCTHMHANSTTLFDH